MNVRLTHRKTHGSRAIDRRSTMGRALGRGTEAVSTQDLALVEEAVKTKLILDSVAACLLQQPTLINNRGRGVLPAVCVRITQRVPLRFQSADRCAPRHVT